MPLAAVGSDGFHGSLTSGCGAEFLAPKHRILFLKVACPSLEPLARWHLQWGPHAWCAGGNAQEIVKSYDFPSFADAVAFMAAAAKEIDAWKPPHHPRWENQWKVLNVFFTTWNVDCRVTKLDIAPAKKFDAIVVAWNAGSPRDG